MKSAYLKIATDCWCSTMMHVGMARRVMLVNIRCCELTFRKFGALFALKVETTRI
jgi:hypothetical protein